MVSESDSFYGVLIYADTGSKKRIIRVVPMEYRKAKVLMTGVATYVYLGEISRDCMENPSYYTYDVREGLKYVGGPIDETTEQRLVLKKIMISYLEKLENVKHMYKSAFIRPIIDEDIYDALIIYDVGEYEKSGKISPLLQSMYKENKKFTNMDVYVGFIKQRYEDLNYQMAYLYKFERTVKKLIKKKKFSLANQLLNAEFEKRML